MAAKVEIPKNVLIGLVALAASAVLGLVFLLGRESGRLPSVQLPRQSGSLGPPSPPSGAVKSAEGLTKPISQPAQSPAPIWAPEASPPAAQARPTPPESSVAKPLTTATIPRQDPIRDEVATYFKTVEYIQPASGGDPESMAQQVVAGLGKGDTSGFDEMIRQARAARTRMSDVVPPPPCAAYHREALASLDAGLELMRSMRKALAAPGQESQVLDLADQANALKARSEALQVQEKALKQRYGLTK